MSKYKVLDKRKTLGTAGILLFVCCKTDYVVAFQ